MKPSKSINKIFEYLPITRIFYEYIFFLPDKCLVNLKFTTYSTIYKKFKEMCADCFIQNNVLYKTIVTKRIDSDFEYNGRYGK